MTNQSHAAPDQKSQTVLIVDDDPSMLLLCSTKLERAGYKVLQAAGSSEALKTCSEYHGRIDLLLTDLLLPPQGFSLASASNKFPRVHGHLLVERFLEMKKDVRVLLMSALSKSGTS
jgi:CheY-like chemotaxis protein